MPFAVHPRSLGRWLAVAWGLGVMIVVACVFRAGYATFHAEETAVVGATEIRVRARRWSWEFEYPNGDRVHGELVLEKGRSYDLILSSEDVVHSFFVPELGLQHNVVPGHPSVVHFTPVFARTAVIYCAKFCGTGHSGMLAMVRILEPAEYQQFERPYPWHLPPVDAPIALGEQLFLKNSCSVCHGAGGSGRIAGAQAPGPKLAGIHDTMRAMVTGESIRADAGYLRESILRPSAHVVAGYSALKMPAFVMKDEQVEAIVAYVQSLE